ncbi:DUF721 domain-containing protein [bacterium]|nr:DUF721 domain-containing protein [bacterium]
MSLREKDGAESEGSQPAGGRQQCRQEGSFRRRRASGYAPHRNWKGYRLRGERRRDRDPDRIDSVLRRVIARRELGGRLAQYAFVTHWHEIVGSRIARHAQPLRIVRGELFVRVENPIWAQELAALQEVILNRLQAFHRDQLSRRPSSEAQGTARRGKAPAEGQPPSVSRLRFVVSDEADLGFQ